MSALFDLAGKRALVTGANTGIGQGIALALAAAGAEIVGAGRSSMADTARMIDECDGRFVPLEVDLARTPGRGVAVERAVAEAGPLDILVNNAGIIRRSDAVDFTETDWDDVVDLNLKAAFFLSQAFARHVMGEGRGGKIVNVASVLSFQGGIRVASYTASKSGLAGLTRLLACEWAGLGINVNGIAPGYVVTNNTAALRADSDRSAEILKRIPAGRWGRPSDLAGAAVFLASPASDYVHGAIIPVDGGWLAR
jgi:2-dehydro-3-deoxy-D-gluconate 5-dehydrogenase